MAEAYLNSEERARVYRLLFELNRSFHLIVCRLSEADKFGIWNGRELKEMRGLAQEVQMEINTFLLEDFGMLEARDLVNYGRVRVAMEKRLRS